MIVNWGIVVEAFALGIGTISIVRLHGRRISESKGYDRFLSAWLLITLAVFIVVGLGTGEFSKSSQYTWIYQTFYQPISSTMYASLCFYVSYTCYRMLRLRSIDGLMFALSAFIVILGNTPLFASTLTSTFYLREWLYSILISGPYRAIRITVGIGAVILGIRTLLGLETGYLGRK